MQQTTTPRTTDSQEATAAVPTMPAGSAGSAVPVAPSRSGPDAARQGSQAIHIDQTLHVEIPRPEHPRPDFQRERWLNLNGRWRFTFDPHNLGEQMRWYHVPHPAAAARTGEGSPIEDPFGAEIVVPFPWESRLSGIHDPEYKGVAWYQRSVEVPAEWASTRGAKGSAQIDWRWRPYLCFGAVDWNAKVWVNGRFVTEHDGGYSPFAIDLSHHVRPGIPATVTVRAWDACDADVPLGKQVDEWYTHSGGIWQTVWLEARPAAHLSRIHLAPDLPKGKATFSIGIEAHSSATRGAYRLAVESDDDSFPTVERTFVLQGGHTDASLDVEVPQPRAWSPEEPHLYHCTVTLTPLGEGDGAASARAGRTGDVAASEADRVVTYFGLRSMTSQRWDDRPYEFVCLNGEPVYLRGALDQAFHPDSLHAYPSDEAIRADIQAAKDLGLNMLRCHIKVNDPRYYYWADKLGMLVMYDLPTAGIYTPKARANWEQTFRDALERDYSHPSILSWILFNETWGLEEHRSPTGWKWVQEMYYLAKQLDPTRLVEDNSTFLWDHVTTDINTWHFYIGDYDRARRHIESVVSQTYEGSPFHYVGGVYGDVQGAEAYRQGTQPLLNSEYAGLSAWGGDCDISYSFKFLTTELRRHDMICGYVYTELTDIEWEHNGLLNYDRSPKEFGYDHFVPGMTVADLNGADLVGLDCSPCQMLRPGTVFTAPVFVSHWDRRKMAQATLRWRATMIDRFGKRRAFDEGERTVRPRQYGVAEAGTVEFTLPDELCLVTVALWLADEAGNIRSRNYVNVDVYSSRLKQEAERTERGYALRFLPGDFAGSSWHDVRVGPRSGKFGARGAGWVDYAVVLPEDLDVSNVQRLRLLFEAGARTARDRVDWKDALHVSDREYPQTETRKLPTRVVVWINGVRLGAVTLPDDPADARGVLSLYNSEHWETASFGFLTTLEADTAMARRILDGAQGGRLLVRFEVPRTGPTGGLNLYGARMGAYPVDPTVFLELMNG
ncbi:MAG: hypothetical protein HY332_15145 [Chloroflexi bacterium]|nr:hypothetical protein [Chloroflexota bacterium]